MLKIYAVKIRSLPLLQIFYLFVLLSFAVSEAMAGQMAMVIADRALIYSDLEMTSPVGYVSRGKKLTVGEIPRNKAQVYPIIVSGRIAYIRVLDVTTEKESMDSGRLVAERFQKSTAASLKSKISATYFAFSSMINNLPNRNAEIIEGDSLMWNGLSLRGEIELKKKIDLLIIANYMATTHTNESFNVFEFGAGLGYRFFNFKRLTARADAVLLSIPFSSYALGSLYRVNSYGYTLGGGMNLSYLLNQHWGVEVNGGIFYTKLLGYKVPDPFYDIAPSFFGSRLGLGVNYNY